MRKFINLDHKNFCVKILYCHGEQFNDNNRKRCRKKNLHKYIGKPVLEYHNIYQNITFNA